MCQSDSYVILVSAVYREKYGKMEMGSFNGLISNLIDVLIRSASDFAMAFEKRFYYLYISQNKTQWNLDADIHKSLCSDVEFPCSTEHFTK